MNKLVYKGNEMAYTLMYDIHPEDMITCKKCKQQYPKGWVHRHD